jgi:guanylate kinase
MGKIFTISGPSGVGKTTFFQQLFKKVDGNEIVLIPRYTDRPIREDEVEGFEYYFTSHDGLLQKVYSNDFIHLEKWGDFYSGIDTRLLKKVINSNDDGLILASSFGASRLKATFGTYIQPLYIWTGHEESLQNPRSLEKDSPEIKELKWRIKKKVAESAFGEYEISSLTNEDFIDKRMVDNYLDIASVNGRLRSGEDIIILPNLNSKLEQAVEHFLKIRNDVKQSDIKIPNMQNRNCFVIMPFKEEMKPIYTDYIQKICKKLKIKVTRADQIFTSNALMDDINKSVLEASIIIADLTSNNPNVLYELGICHALGKTVILITQEENAPTDIFHIKRIPYKFTPPGMKKFESDLTETLKNFIEINKL